MTDTPAASDDGTAILRVVKGDPSAEELAALVAVVSARAAAPPASADPDRASDWATYWRTRQRPLHPGPGRWRASAHP
ncbi:hypothetical protein Kfla_1438 [Kribbella flavida DSM 17836]|uniref:Acyl-CoA carboxylase epsilon subunit n=1 Tax=Kribbella flavida (strain DSM 17836 / JCM 10339 / NBRC 14399) TaxID=479435 RepID=D2PKM7_KRIFD|nr:acyl-CoA carboxylase subunit epsilon [Kribbella flavida]ADB30539.1 hypothetical protein Kfla_1438 [Kribbella flavida DSM 17836]